MAPPEGSNSARPQFIASSGMAEERNTGTMLLMDDVESHQVMVSERHSWKNLLSYTGPGFLVSIAYIDPGNFETDLQAGAKYKYELLWVILVASCAALLIQSLAANLGVVTGKHLAEHCRNEYPRKTNIVLWIIAEISIVACDIPEVIGTAFALNMLFSIPLWCGVLLTGLSTLILLALQKYGVRKLELLIAILVFTIAGCFLGELGYAKPNSTEVLEGLFIPLMKGNGATGLAISLLGAMVMPHNLFLHSALVLSRKIPRSIRGIKEACRFYLIESAFALTIAFFINLSIISVSGSVCNSSNLDLAGRKNCEDLDLNKASFLLKNTVGSWSSKIFAIALLASGQSSTITGTYAGQYVMQGFLNLRFQPWLRNLLTRCLAIVPSLVVAIIGGSSGSGQLIITASMILSFELPFALIPLLKFTSSKTKMGPHANSLPITIITWVLGFVIMVINIYFLATSFVTWLIHNNFPKAGVAFIGILGFACMIVYLGGILYLALRKDKKVTYLLPLEESIEIEASHTQGYNNNNNVELNGPFAALPREDIVSLQLPQNRNRGDLN